MDARCRHGTRSLRAQLRTQCNVTCSRGSFWASTDSLMRVAMLDSVEYMCANKQTCCVQYVEGMLNRHHVRGPFLQKPNRKSLVPKQMMILFRKKTNKHGNTEPNQNVSTIVSGHVPRTSCVHAAARFPIWLVSSSWFGFRPVLARLPLVCGRFLRRWEGRLGGNPHDFFRNPRWKF